MHSHQDALKKCALTGQLPLMCTVTWHRNKLKHTQHASRQAAAVCEYAFFLGGGGCPSYFCGIIVDFYPEKQQQSSLSPVCLLQKALEQTPKNTAGLQPLISQLLKQFANHIWTPPALIAMVSQEVRKVAKHNNDINGCV